MSYVKIGYETEVNKPIWKMASLLKFTPKRLNRVPGEFYSNHLIQWVCHFLIIQPESDGMAGFYFSLFNLMVNK